MPKPRVLLLVVYTLRMLQNRDEVGTGYVGAYLRERGYAVMIVGTSENRIDYDKIEQFAPDVVGLSVYRDSIAEVYKVCQKLRARLPNVTLCLGGVLSTNYHLEIMNKIPLVDVIVRGEGERVFSNLLEHLENNQSLEEVRGITYRRGTEVVANEDERLIPDLDTLPFPSRDILRDNKLKIAVVSTTRGCTGRCTFCESPTYWRDQGVSKWRGRSIKRLVDEVEQIYRTYGIRFFDIVNVSFEDPGSSYGRVREFADEIIKRDLRISYEIPVRATFSRHVPDGLVERLKQSGLCEAFIGVESANEHDVKLFRKMGTLQDNIRSIELFRKHGVKASIGFINLHPYSSFAALRENLSFLHAWGYAGYFMMLKRLLVDKGVELFTKLQNDGLLLEGEPSNGFKYRYVDERVGRLAGFLENYFDEDEEIDTILHLILFYERSFIPCLSYTERQFNANQQHQQAYGIAMEAKQKFGALFADLNERNAQWFTGMIDLAENDWDEGAALELTSRYLSKAFLRDLNTELHAIRNIMYRGLLKLSSEYEYYII